jgi:hypothetical protein
MPNFIKPRNSTIIITLALYFIYLFLFGPLAGTCNKALACQNGEAFIPAFKAYGYFGECGQTCSQVESITSIIIVILALPIIYIILSLILKPKQ